MAELRIRNVSPELQKQLKALENHFKEKTATDAVIKLINHYPGLLNELSQQRREIVRLTESLRVYQGKEGRVKEQLRAYLMQVKYQAKHTETFIRMYGTKKRPAIARRRDRDNRHKLASKKVPHSGVKKGGKK
jgi:hypothetical protein